MQIVIPAETLPGEKRVALVPAAIGSLTRIGLEVSVQAGAGRAAGFPDEEYTRQGAKVVGQRSNLFEVGQVVLQVRTLGANPEAGRADLDCFRKGQIHIGFAEPLTSVEAVAQLASRGVTLLAMELMPRITRAQSMDALSSMATVAGYKAVLLAADALPRMFPMLMTAAGTVRPARVLVIGAGVAGLQAVATARRLGAVVHAYDIRPAVRQQVESLGARFVELPLEAEQAETEGGYARAMDEDFYRRQRELLGRVVADSDVVISTAAVPGATAPVLVTQEMVRGMAPGSVIVDLAAERGGNCELTERGRQVERHGVTVVGYDNVASMVPYHASQMYARNIATFVAHLVKDRQVRIDAEDEITRETLVCRDGEVVHTRVRERMGLTDDPPRSVQSAGDGPALETRPYGTADSAGDDIRPGDFRGL
jgi:NAD(P) transhydrogenase subunit alpha